MTELPERFQDEALPDEESSGSRVPDGEYRMTVGAVSDELVALIPCGGLEQLVIASETALPSKVCQVGRAMLIQISDDEVETVCAIPIPGDAGTLGKGRE